MQPSDDRDDTQDKSGIRLRPAAAGDREFLLRAYAASRAIELSSVSWDDTQIAAFVEHQLDAQTSYYREKYADAAHDIILLDGEAAGRLYVHRGETEISILDITVLTERRKNGIGTALIEGLQKEAAACGRTVSVYVENFNPSQNLFRSLGFSAVGGDEMNILFEWGNSGSGD